MVAVNSVSQQSATNTRAPSPGPSGLAGKSAVATPPPPAQTTPAEVDTGEFPNVPSTPQPAPAQAQPINSAQPANTSSFQSFIKQWLTPNPLNAYYQPTYHFRLFMTGEQDLLSATNSSSISDLLSKIKTVPQVTIAESGVTGYNIKEVEIDTVISTNSATRDQKATGFKMVVTEPMGISFLDGLAHAGAFLKVQDYTKINYYLQLSFTGYTENGQFAGNPIPLGFKNGGQWIWSLKITNIETKVNEGGGVYTLTMVITETEALVIEEKALCPPGQTLTVSGKTLGELFDDYASKMNDAWKKQFSSPQNKSLMTFKIVTHPVPFDPYNGSDPKTFSLQPQKKDESPIRSLNFDKSANSSGQYTAHVAAGVTVSEFITSAIKSTEQGQALFKNEPLTTQIDGSSSEVNAQGIRVSTLFSVETIFEPQEFDTQTGNYTQKVTIHVIPRYSQGVIATRDQVDDANTAAGQQKMLSSLGNNGFLKKRYDYIFTGLNTEVIDFNIDFNLAWQAVLPKLAGARLNYLTEATHARTVTRPPDTAPYDKPTAQKECVLSPVPLNSTTGNLPAQPQQPQQLLPQTLSVLRQAPSGPRSLVSSNVSNLFGVIPTTGEVGAAIQRLQGNTPTPPATQPTMTTQPVSQPQSQNLYIEDILTQENQGQAITSLPISFRTAYLQAQRDAGTGMLPQEHRGQSVMGLATQIYDSGNLITGAFQTVELTIRGDPYWIGQGNYERRIQITGGGPTLDTDANTIPDWSSGNPCFFLYFKYPLQIGDDFKPVLKDSQCFNGLYQVTSAHHTFSDGAFKQTLKAVRLPLIRPDIAFSNDPSLQTGQTSTPFANNNNGGTPASGSTPGTGSGDPSQPRGLRNNNPTNLAYNSGQTNVQSSDGRFGVYPTMQDGVAAAENQLLLNQNRGATTVNQQIAIWAPSSDGNNTQSYANFVAKQLNVGPDDTIDVSNPQTAQTMIGAMTQRENGQSIDPSIIQQGVAKRLGS